MHELYSSVDGLEAPGADDAELRAQTEALRAQVAQLSRDFAAASRLLASAIEAADLALIVEGIGLRGARRRARWEPQEIPTAPSTIMRNALGVAEGGSDKALDRAGHRRSVAFCEAHANWH